MSVLDAFILGLVQGLTEFLPVSSSGHLLLLEKLGVGTPSLTLNLALHLATLGAVLTVYRKQFWNLIKHPLSKTTAYYVAACVPTVLLALLFKRYFYGLLMGSYLPLCFMFTAFLLALCDYCKPHKISTLSYKNTFLTGVMQGIAVLPGISRSGATIAALTLQGVNKTTAKEFAFMLSAPVILGGAIYEFIGAGGDINFAPLPFFIALVTAFIAGLASVYLTGRAVERGRFLPFSIYLVLISAISFIVIY